MSCDSCVTFSLIGETYTVYLKMPSHDGEDNSISKNINRFNFWSGHYTIHDDGIAEQPLTLTGIESASCDDEFGICLAVGKLCFPLCFNSKLMNKFKFINEMRDDNEEITISGLGDCMDAVYIIKSFSYRTIKKTVHAISWTLTLEKVRNS